MNEKNMNELRRIKSSMSVNHVPKSLFSGRGLVQNMGMSFAPIGIAAQRVAINMMEIVETIRVKLRALFDDDPVKAKQDLMKYSGFGEKRVDKLLKRERNAARRRGIESSFGDLCVNVLIKRMEKKAQSTIGSNLASMREQTDRALFTGNGGNDVER